MNNDFNVLKWVFGAIFGLILLFIIPSLLGFRTIDAGERGVVRRFGGTTGRVLSPGAHFVTPFVETAQTVPVRTMIYETTTEEKQAGSNADYKDYPVDTNTSDGQRVDIFYTIRFNINPDRVEDVINEYQDENNLIESVIKTESRTWVRNIPREFDAETLYTGDGVVEMQNRIADRLRPKFEEEGLYLDAVGIREIQFTDEYVNAIEAKQIAEVQIETERNVAEQEKFRKEARVTAAEAAAREQELQRTTISNELLQKMWIERWNGELPTYMMGDGTPLIQVPS